MQEKAPDHLPIDCGDPGFRSRLTDEQRSTLSQLENDAVDDNVLFYLYLVIAIAQPIIGAAAILFPRHGNGLTAGEIIGICALFAVFAMTLAVAARKRRQTKQDALSVRLKTYQTEAVTAWLHR